MPDEPPRKMGRSRHRRPKRLLPGPPEKGGVPGAAGGPIRADSGDTPRVNDPSPRRPAGASGAPGGLPAGAEPRKPRNIGSNEPLTPNHSGHRFKRIDRSVNDASVTGERGARAVTAAQSARTRPALLPPPPETERDYLAVCTKGLEPVLAGELRALGALAVNDGRGSVRFRGSRAVFYKAVLHLRTATRVLEPVVEGDAGTSEALYDLVRSVDWSAYMRVDQTLAVDANIRDSNANHSGFAALKVKDAVVDQFRDKCGRRPSVERDRPDMRLALRIFRNKASLAIDACGESLHKRGYRPIQVKSPLNEALAAGILLLTDWDRKSPLVDPMCGSATFLIEAALLAGGVPPGIFRKRFPFQGRPDFDRTLWERILAEGRRGVRPVPRGLLLGADFHAGAIELAKIAVRNAGFQHVVSVECKDIGDWAPPAPPARVVVNPPYGERIGEAAELPGLYEKLGAFLKGKCQNASAFVFSGNADLTQHIGLKATRRWPIWNGPIECRLLQYDMY